MFATTAIDVWTIATPISPARRASGFRYSVAVRAQVTSRPTAILREQTVVIKWSWISRGISQESHIVKAEQNCPKICYDETHSCVPILKNPKADVFAGCKRRALRIIVEQELPPLTRLTDPHELAVAYKGIVQCHHWLYDTAKVLHRDISISNLMFQRIDDKLYGVLSDFDLTDPYGRTKSSISKLHSGTRAYMAIDHLDPKPPKHRYRHNLESFLYVLVFLTCELEGSQLAEWIDLGMRPLRNSKIAAITAGFPPEKNEFAVFWRWIVGLRLMFREGQSNRDTHEVKVRYRSVKRGDFDELTLGGAVTFDKFEAVLDLDHLEVEAMEEEDDYAEEDEDIGGNGGEDEQEDGDYVNEDDDGEGEQDDDDYDFRLDRGRLTDLERYGR